MNRKDLINNIKDHHEFAALLELRKALERWQSLHKSLQSWVKLPSSIIQNGNQTISPEKFSLLGRQHQNAYKALRHQYLRTRNLQHDLVNQAKIIVERYESRT